MAAYVIYHQHEVTDAAGWESYRANIRGLLADFGGRVLAAEPAPRVLEGEWAGARNVLIEFPDMDAVERWHASDAYRPLLELRQKAATGSLIALNGV